MSLNVSQSCHADLSSQSPFSVVAEPPSPSAEQPISRAFLKPAIRDIVEAARLSETKLTAALHAGFARAARQQRAREAWERVATFKGNRIPITLTDKQFRRWYAKLIVELGTVLKVDGWQEKLNAVRPEPGAKTYALAILEEAMIGDIDTVEKMLDESIATLLSLGLRADRWLRDGLRYEVLDIPPEPGSPFVAANDLQRPEANRIDEVVSDYVRGNPSACVEDVVSATGLRKGQIKRAGAWKRHEEHRLEDLLQKQPDASVREIQEVLGYSASKIVNMGPWKERQARRRASKRQARIKERPFTPSLLACLANQNSKDPTARAEHRDEIFRVVLENCAPDYTGPLKRLQEAEREQLLDRVVAIMDENEMQPRDRSEQVAILVEAAQSWLDDHEQDKRRTARANRSL